MSGAAVDLYWIPLAARTVEAGAVTVKIAVLRLGALPSPVTASWTLPEA